MIVCVLIPRLALLASVGERRELLRRPIALAPEPGGPQVIGEPSGPAEAFGIHRGMRLGEALARCPELALVAPDGQRAEASWEGTQRRLEEIGAAIETARPGEAFFEGDGLRGLCGGSTEGVLRHARRAIGPAARLGGGPGRLCAYAAALRSRPRRAPVIVKAGGARAFLASLPVGILRDRLPDEWERFDLPATLERLGIRTLGELAALPGAAIADRFGEAGLRALDMARGIEAPLRPRHPTEDLVERVELPEAVSGQRFERALELLIARLLAAPGRRGRTFRRLRLAARLAGEGSWQAEVTLRVASADPERLRLVILPKLSELPAPATSLSLRAVALGPPAHEQPTLTRSSTERHGDRLREAVRQARATAGRDAVLRVLEMDPDSRVPERRAILTPFEPPE
jgi:protein ImuB